MFWVFVVCYLTILFVYFQFLFHSYLIVSHFEEQGLARLVSGLFCGDFPSSISTCNLKTLFSLLFFPCSFSNSRKMGADLHLFQAKLVIGWENNRNGDITMPLSLKTIGSAGYRDQ